ncbi:hypothetical protein DFJ74DRAFT_663024 [Hyaloraphidium curvatum]|nr:hypothetical protein DFJ74DRAFT_663024 [Hyaloraphidium curvatum]
MMERASKRRNGAQAPATGPPAMATRRSKRREERTRSLPPELFLHILHYLARENAFRTLVSALSSSRTCYIAGLSLLLARICVKSGPGGLGSGVPGADLQGMTPAHFAALQDDAPAGLRDRWKLVQEVTVAGAAFPSTARDLSILAQVLARVRFGDSSCPARLSLRPSQSRSQSGPTQCSPTSWSKPAAGTPSTTPMIRPCECRRAPRGFRSWAAPSWPRHRWSRRSAPSWRTGRSPSAPRP